MVYLTGMLAIEVHTLPSSPGCSFDNGLGISHRSLCGLRQRTHEIYISKSTARHHPNCKITPATQIPSTVNKRCSQQLNILLGPGISMQHSIQDHVYFQQSQTSRLHAYTFGKQYTSSKIPRKCNKVHCIRQPPPGTSLFKHSRRGGLLYRMGQCTAAPASTFSWPASSGWESISTPGAVGQEVLPFANCRILPN